MFRHLMYDNLGYLYFMINEEGDVLNLKTNKILKKSIFKDGYYHVTLPMGKRGQVKSIRIHKAIAETFIPNPLNLPIVNHIDENKLNCNIDNLEWVTSQENTKKHWDYISQQNWFCNNRKLTKENIKYIKDNPDKLSSTKLAKIYNVSKTTIFNIKHNKLYNFGL